jgi:RNA polymerase sigma-70 factor (ECF subfamily)
LSEEAHEWERLRAGEPTAWDRFVRTHYLRLYRWLYRLAGRQDDAEDLTQQSFAAFWESLRRRVPDVAARNWLYAIARNQWRLHCRRTYGQRKRREADLDGAAVRDPPPLEPGERRELADALEAAISDLPEEFREVFSLRVWDEFEYGEIAAIQGVSADLVRWRFFRAREMLRGRLGAWWHAEEGCQGE